MAERRKKGKEKGMEEHECLVIESDASVMHGNR